MAYERVQKSFGKSSSQKKQSKFAPPPIDQQIETDSLPSAKVSKSIIPSKEERDAIRRSLFEKWGNAPQKQDLTNTLQDVPASLSVTGIPIRAKLTIGAPGDKYEQEADRVAAQVVKQINAPSQQPNQNLQREGMSEEDELQMKSETDTIQHIDLPEEELQMKPMLQLQAGVGGLTATPDLETSIQQARGGGQPLAGNIREPMEQAFGADFSGVKVHIDSQADQLNQAIQARAFTTGQDVFFRQGEYKPGSRGGQELLAHELTHVVQQKGGAVQRAPQTSEESPKYNYKRNGMDKTYYYAEGEQYGWLEVKDDSIIAAEIAAKNALKEIGVKVPDIKQDPPPSLIYQKDGTGVPPSKGYWIQHVPHEKTFKPKMNVHALMKPMERIIDAVPQESRGKMEEDLSTILKEIEKVADVVGELSLAVHKETGEVFLLDFAPTGGNVGGKDLAEQAAKGIENIINHMKTLSN